MPFGRAVSVVTLILLTVMAIPIPSALAQPTFVSVARISGGTGPCGTGGATPACSLTRPPAILDQPAGFGYSLSLNQNDGSSSMADDPWNPANAPSPGTDSGNSQYQFVVQEPVGRRPYIVLGGANSITWSYSSSTGRLTITGTTMRAHLTSPSIDLTGFGFFVVDQLMASPINSANMNSFTGVTVETNAESFSFGLVSPVEWTLTVSGRTGTTGYWNAFIPQAVLTSVGATASNIALTRDGVAVGVSPTLVTGKVTIDGTDYPGYTLSLPSISYSTHTFDTDIAPPARAKSETQAARLSDGIDGASFARTAAGMWGSTVDAVVQQINAGIAAVNQLYPATKGQPSAILASGGNIMPGHGGVLQVVFGGSVDMVFLISYGVDGKIGVLLQYSAPPKATSSPSAPSSQPPSSAAPPIQAPNASDSGQQNPLVFRYQRVEGTNGASVYALSVIDQSGATANNQDSTSRSSVLLQVMPTLLTATLVAACVALFNRNRR